MKYIFVSQQYLLQLVKLWPFCNKRLYWTKLNRLLPQSDQYFLVTKDSIGQKKRKLLSQADQHFLLFWKFLLQNAYSTWVHLFFNYQHYMLLFSKDYMWFFGYAYYVSLDNTLLSSRDGGQAAVRGMTYGGWGIFFGSRATSTTVREEDRAVYIWWNKLRFATINLF